MVPSSVTMLPPQLCWLPLLAALLPPVPAQKFSALTVSPEPHPHLPRSFHARNSCSPPGQGSRSRWPGELQQVGPGQSHGMRVTRLGSYSHVKGCRSYQSWKEGSWNTGMSVVLTLGGRDERRSQYLGHRCPTLSQVELTLTGHPPCHHRPSLGLAGQQFPTRAPRGPTVSRGVREGTAARGLYLWRKVAEIPFRSRGRNRNAIELKTIFLLLRNS